MDDLVIRIEGDDNSDQMTEQERRIQALEERNKAVERQSLLRELSHTGRDPAKYDKYTNTQLQALVEEVTNNPKFNVFEKEEKEEKGPLVFNPGTYQGGKWE